MKESKIIILLISIIYVYSSPSIKICNIKNPSKPSDCFDIYSLTEKENGNFCCYLNYKVQENEFTVCKAFFIEEMNIIYEYINSQRFEKEKDDTDELKIIKFECKCSYLGISLLSLIFLLL